MILFLLSLITVGNCIPVFWNTYNNFILINNNFSAQITNNGIIINNINIKYESLGETNNNYKQLYFDLIKGNEYSITYIKSNFKSNFKNNKSNKFKFDILHEITSNYTTFINKNKNINCKKEVTKYENNKLYVSMNIEHWDFEDKNNDLVFEFSIDSFSEIYNNTIMLSDYKINFNKECIIDGYDENISLIKSGRKYKLYFPYFNHKLYYDFNIELNSKNEITV